MCQSSVLVPSDHHVAQAGLRLALLQVEKLEESTSFDDRSWINGQYPDMVKRMQYGTYLINFLLMQIIINFNCFCFIRMKTNAPYL